MATKQISEDLMRSPSLSLLKPNESITSVDTFCANEMVGYGREICSHRAIPSYIDGLKESTRKVLWCAKEHIRASPLKVFQLCGIVAYEMAYVHGDISLNKAIIGMAQPHNSNLNMLDGIGQFGGYHFRSAASPRYVSVKLSPLFDNVFMDNDLLTPQYSDGVECEPKYMLPIIPYVLCNSISGIAMGFASNIIARDMQDIVKECIRTLKSIQKGQSPKAKNLTPKIPGFKGSCTPSASTPKQPNDGNIWDVHGVYAINKKGDIHIEEFIGEQEAFLDDLNALRDSKTITYICNPDMTYDVKLKSGVDLDDKLKSKLHIESKLTENPTFVDENENIKIFKYTSEIIPQFIKFRMQFYKTRLEKLIDKANLDILIANNRIRFIKEHEKFYKKKDIDKLLEADKFDKVKDSYEYLLSMRVDSLSAEKIKALEDKLKELKSTLKELKSTDYIDMYLSDLEELLGKYNKAKTKE